MPAKKVTPRGQAAAPVEPNIGPAIPKRPVAKKTGYTPISDKPGVKYVRNIRGIQCRFTLQDGKGRRIELAPRGQRGDIDIVNKEDQEDPIYIMNLDLLFEEITPTQAKEIISNQQTNSKRDSHPIFDQLTNAQGKKYEQSHATIEQSIEAQAITVAKIKEAGDGRNTQGNTEVVRSGPEMTQVPGSPGHAATDLVNSVPGDIDPTEYHEFLIWKQYKEALDRQEKIRDDLKG